MRRVDGSRSSRPAGFMRKRTHAWVERRMMAFQRARSGLLSRFLIGSADPMHQ